MKDGFYISKAGAVHLLETTKEGVRLTWSLRDGELCRDFTYLNNGTCHLERGDWEYAGVTRLDLYQTLKKKAHIKVFGS